jgi:hypothetical protein
MAIHPSHRVRSRFMSHELADNMIRQTYLPIRNGVCGRGWVGEVDAWDPVIDAQRWETYSFVRDMVQGVTDEPQRPPGNES